MSSLPHVENGFPTLYQEFIHLSRYARWEDEAGRRETWVETVDRYIDYMFNTQCGGKLNEYKDEVRKAILKLDVMPSMRCLMTAGSALAKDQVAGYNCSYCAIDDQVAFDEILYVLMCGAGVGFSVERQFIDKLPVIPEKLRESKTMIVVEDSKIGWANALRELISMLYQGRIPQFDVSSVRPAGARLKTFGGRASGPGPLLELFRFITHTFKQATSRKLNSIECHDICCKIGEIVVVGGVRRSALISLSNPSDDRMRYAKSGEWWKENPQRAMSNNSACYTEKPECDRFMREWLALMDSKSGERGIFNRTAAKKNIEKYGRRDPNHEFGSNPCSEIVLRSCGFCNLSEVVVRSGDTAEDLKRKVRLATIIGTVQSTMTNFRYLRPKWKENAEEERLLGVSMTGIMDNSLTSGRDGKKKLTDTLDELRLYAVAINKEFAKILGINPSVAITCVKPSGTVSQLVNCASGIHPRFSHFYIRTVRADKKDPLAKLMVDLGFPYELDVTKPEHNYVFSFPERAAKEAVVTDDVCALDQLELWKIYQKHWTEHKPSVTIHIKDHEWLDVGAWVYRNFDEISGIAFLPYSGHTYRQAPYQEITEEQYELAVTKMPKEVDWSLLKAYEVDDSALIGYKELACSGGKCEEVDIVRSEPPTMLDDGTQTKF
jgi:ribonucleoside-diphosphate reductase alpha chain